MKKIKSKIAWLLVFVMCISLLPVSVFADTISDNRSESSSGISLKGLLGAGEKTQVTVKAPTMTVTYGDDYKQPWQSTAPKSYEERLKDGVTITDSDGNDLTGSVALDYEISIVDAQRSNGVGLDVGSYEVQLNGAHEQDKYEVTFVPGQLTVIKAGAELWASPALRFYDGVAPIPENLFAFDDLPYGDKVDLSEHSDPQVTEPGTYNRDFEGVKIKGANGVAVTDNYTLSWFNNSVPQIIIFKIPIVINISGKTDESVIYDGEEHTVDYDFSVELDTSKINGKIDGYYVFADSNPRQTVDGLQSVLSSMEEQIKSTISSQSFVETGTYDVAYSVDKTADVFKYSDYRTNITKGKVTIQFSGQILPDLCNK